MFSRRILSGTSRHVNVKRMITTVKSMEVQEFATIIKEPNFHKTYQVIDVREPDELAIANCGPEIINLPLSASNIWSSDIKLGKYEILDGNKPTLCLCHHGRRSMMMAQFLIEQADYENVYNIEGGIDKYSMECDATVPRY